MYKTKKMYNKYDKITGPYSLNKHYNILIKAIFLCSRHRASATGQFKKIQSIQRSEDLNLNHVVLAPPSRS